MNDQELSGLASLAATAEGWARLRVTLGVLPPESAFILLRVVGEKLPIDTDVEGLLRSGADADGQLIAGAVFMVRASRLRGMGTADLVPDQAWDEYFTCRDRAEDLLRRSLAQRPGHGVTAAWLMASTIDTEIEVKAEVVTRLEGATDVPLSGYSKALSASTRKWGGSHELMWKFARRHAQLRWPWSGALIAKAHYEHWLYLARMDERPVAEWEAGAYFRDVAVCEELQDLSAALFAGQSDDPYEEIFAHDVLAAVLAEAGMRKMAARHLRRVGLFGDPALLTGGPWWRRMLIRASKGLAPW